VDGLFDPIDAGDASPALTYQQLADWFHGVEAALSPHDEAVDAGGQLSSARAGVEEALRAPELSFYALEVHPELGSPKEPPPSDEERARLVLPLAVQQLQLMERVFLALGLEQPKYRDYAGNRGWMNLLRRWAAAPSFRRAYLGLVSSCSPGFQHFCKHSLDLDVEYVWVQSEARPRPSGDVAAFAFGLADGCELVLLVREAGGASLRIGEAVMAPTGGRPSITLRPGFDSADLRRAAQRGLDRFLARQGRGECPDP
jgi:hypothetical protein